MQIRDRASGRVALWAFVAVECFSFAVFLHAGSQRWFGFDDWDFLAGRRLTNLDDLLAPHIGHWMTVPLVIYRLLFALVGLRYLPYLLVQITLHTGIAALLRIIMRRAAVGPWVATIAAGAYALFGTGWDFTTQAFGIVISLPVMFGLTAVLLTDHDGPFDRRDGCAMILTGLMVACSSVGSILVISLALTVWMRRGLRPALLLSLPPAGLFLVWYVAVRSNAETFGADPSLTALFRLPATGIIETLRALGRFGPSGWALTGLLVVGLVMAGRRIGWSVFRKTENLPVGLLAGGGLWFVALGLGRLGPFASVGDIVKKSHYLDTAAIFVLPALALALSEVLRYNRPIGTLGIALLLIGIPGNLQVLERGIERKSPFAASARETFLRIARNPLAAEVPRNVRPDPVIAYPVTIGWLRDALAVGRLPATERPSSAQELQDELRLSLRQRSDRFSPPGPCRPLESKTIVTLEKGDSFVVGGLSWVPVELRSRGEWSLPVPYGPRFGELPVSNWITAVRGPLTLRISPPPGQSPRFCLPK